MSATPVAQFDHASIGYGDITVVRDVSLRIAQGDVLALLGTNGSGKSTLIRGLLGLADVQTGSVQLFGHPIGRHDRAKIGYVPQRTAPSGPIPATVREVVMTGRLARHRVFLRPSADDRRAVAEAIELVGLTDKTKASVTELSGGQHRRVLIARALAAEPRFLVLDEPTAGVDITQQETFVEVLSALVEQGVTILVVTHELGPMLPIISRIAVMQEGRLSYDGPLLPELAAGHGGDHHHHHDEPPGLSPLAGLVPDLSLGRRKDC